MDKKWRRLHLLENIFWFWYVGSLSPPLSFGIAINSCLLLFYSLKVYSGVQDRAFGTTFHYIPLGSNISSLRENPSQSCNPLLDSGFMDIRLSWHTSLGWGSICKPKPDLPTIPHYTHKFCSHLHVFQHSQSRKRHSQQKPAPQARKDVQFRLFYFSSCFKAEPL